MSAKTSPRTRFPKMLKPADYYAMNPKMSEQAYYDYCNQNAEYESRKSRRDHENDYE